MSDTSTENLEEALRKEIQRLWSEGQLNGIVQVIKEHCSPEEFYQTFAVMLKFDLGVYTDGGKKWHMVPLAMIAPTLTSQRFSGVAFGLLPRAKYTGPLRQIP
jgi:hypothetical protein